jgi:hypothetical protein
LSGRELGDAALKPTGLALGLMTAASLLLAGIMFYSAYCKWFDRPIPWFIGPTGAIAALVLVAAGKTIRLPGPGRD